MLRLKVLDGGGEQGGGRRLAVLADGR